MLVSVHELDTLGCMQDEKRGLAWVRRDLAHVDEVGRARVSRNHENLLTIVQVDLDEPVWQGYKHFILIDQPGPTNVLALKVRLHAVHEVPLRRKHALVQAVGRGGEDRLWLVLRTWVEDGDARDVLDVTKGLLNDVRRRLLQVDYTDLATLMTAKKEGVVDAERQTGEHRATQAEPHLLDLVVFVVVDLDDTAAVWISHRHHEAHKNMRIRYLNGVQPATACAYRVSGLG